MGPFRDCPCLYSGHCFSAVHVRYDSDRSLFPEAGHTGGLAGGFYDGFDPVKSAADHLQRSAWQCGACGTYHHMFPVRVHGWIADFCFLS